MQLIDRYNYEDTLCKDAETRYLSYPEGSDKTNFYYNDMNRHYEVREDIEAKLSAYRKQKEEIDQEEEIDEFEKQVTCLSFLP